MANLIMSIVFLMGIFCPIVSEYLPDPWGGILYVGSIFAAAYMILWAISETAHE